MGNRERTYQFLVLMVYLVAFVSIAFSAFAQYLLKIGVSGLSFSREAGFLNNLKLVVTDWPLIGGISCYVISMVLWLFVLSKMEMSKAYPLVSIGYILTLFLGYFLLDEPLTIAKLVGVSIIVIGVVILTGF